MNLALQRMIDRNFHRIEKCVTARLVTLLILVAFPFGLISAETEPVGFQVKYTIYFGDIKIGNSIRTVVNGKDGNIYAEHDVRAGGLLRLLGEDSYTERSTFQYSGNEVIPIAFKITNDSNHEVASAEFDWTDRKVLFGSGKVFDMPEHQTVDWESWYVQLILRRTESLENQYMTVVEQNRLRSYVFQDAVPEQITFRGNAVDTVKITMQDVNRKNRKYVVWVYPELHNIPIRIDKIKKGQGVSFIATLFEFVYPE